MRGGRDRPGYRVDASYWRRTGRMQIPNPIAMLLREQDTLGVTPAQADSLAVLNRQYVASVDSLWAEMSEAVAAAPPGDVDRVYALHRDARHAQVDMLILLVREINSMLTPQQRRRLSPFARQYLDVRLLRTIRKGSSGFADFR